MNLTHYEREVLAILNDLIGYLIKNGCAEQDAKDIAQDTIVKILEIEDVLPYSKIRPWIFRVGINLYYNLYNRKKRYQEILHQQYQSSEWLELEVDYSELHEALAQLEVKDVTLLVLKYEEGLSFEEIGFILNRPKESLKTELYRLRKKLRKIMEEREV
ncbi:RNA polymerase sigma factor [Vagococcus sp. PNs007]|uniref:RNA polymerase sigma factor n=1 Tax=Vagococcus proximus TaxID=2991417 RepID=A0ABT5WZ70_9ENTE|nr:RNA polymerase sigma factor [Vagococcus proximus]MDF0479019.1 RNA polymerase sigma factor [Vagococcus proximus]